MSDDAYEYDERFSWFALGFVCATLLGMLVR